MTRKLSWLCALIALAAFAMTSPALAQSRAGTTLAASKTIDICEVDEDTWRYSGEVSAWNQGSKDTENFDIEDCIQNKEGAGKFEDAYCTDDFDPPLQEIPKGTTKQTATVFKYSFEDAPLSGDIRNIARVTITNHSGSLGEPKGPEPKATWEGEVLPCDNGGGCVLTQGYWKNHLEDWPDPYDPAAAFYLSGKSWQAVLNTPPGGNGYYILAVQYIAAVLNKGDGAAVPSGVQDILDLAEDWFSTNAPAACPLNSSCGTQKTWGGILDTYNNGKYPGGPPHCD